MRRSLWSETPESTKRPVYFDYNATTPVDPAVVSALTLWLEKGFGNPSSDHLSGREARRQVEASREEVSALIGSEPDEVVFAGSATEANNLAILGIANAMEGGKNGLLVTSAIEHPSGLGPFIRLGEKGWRTEFLPVDPSGRVDLGSAGRIIGPETVFASLMLANNETGAIQPVRAIADLAHARGARVHVDAAQAAGKVPVDVKALGADLLTLAGQKFYAPKGIGVLYVRRGTPLLPVMAGGGQERGLRSGTENVPTIAPLGTDSRLVREHFRRESVRMEEPRDRLHGKLAKGIPGLLLNGPPAERLPNTLNFSFPRVRGRDLLTSLPWIAASTGSACPGGVQKMSSGLRAMGLDPERAWGAVRLSVGRPTTLPEVDRVSEDLINAWKSLVS